MDLTCGHCGASVISRDSKATCITCLILIDDGCIQPHYQKFPQHIIVDGSGIVIPDEELSKRGILPRSL